MLSTTPAKAVLTICAFKSAEVYINDKKVPSIKSDNKHWKSSEVADVTDQLHVGTNEITVWVTNNAGPPALWLRLQTENFSLSSDDHWQVSLTGEFWNPAHLASQPIPVPRWSPIYDGTSTFESVKKEWQTLALFVAIALGIVLIAGRISLIKRNFKIKLPPIYILLAVVVLARIVLFMNEAPNLPGWVSFDEPSHLAYIKYVHEHGKLPPPSGGAEMHQPPLYYLITAATMKLCNCPLANVEVNVPLRAVNGIIGLLHCWLALLCLRLLFPNNFSAQAVGLLIAAWLPPYLYLSIGITNDPLTELCVTAAFYFLLRILQSEDGNFRLHAALGLSLGAAMLSKLSAFPAVLVFFFILGLRLVLDKKSSPRDWLRNIGMAMLLCVAICGWHYLRIWARTGSIAIPASVGSSWWQTPGFRTISYYLSFGHVFVQPLFAGLNSFADGIYSTLWGDGMISGATEFIFRPPWNYDLMKVGYLLALPLSIFALAGGVIALRFIRGRQLEWLLIVATVCIYLLAVAGLTLLGPWQSQVKAFYAMPAFVPFCALIAAGWNWLAQKSSAWRAGLWALILFWSFTTYASFWINDNSAEFWRSRTVAEIREKNFLQAAGDATNALSINPTDFETRCLLATALTSQKKPDAAIQQYVAAINLNPDSPQVLDMFANMLIGGDKNSARRAVDLSKHACELTGYRDEENLTTLASAYANAGQISEAIATAETAAELARQIGDADLLKQNQKLLERCRAQKAGK